MRVGGCVGVSVSSPAAVNRLWFFVKFAMAGILVSKLTGAPAGVRILTTRALKDKNSANKPQHDMNWLKKAILTNKL